MCWENVLYNCTVQLGCVEKMTDTADQSNESIKLYPMKFITTKCSMTLAKIKSAKALSGLIPINSDLFCEFTCSLRHTPKINDPTLEMNPDKKELNGNVPTSAQ